MAAAKRRARELGSCADDLVRAATPEANPRELQAIVQQTLDAFDGATTAEREVALKTIGRALNNAEGRGEQVLSLTLGAIVEAGASPDLAWPPIAKDFDTLLADAMDFATSAIKHAKDEHVETAIEASGAAVAKKKPREAAAWKALPSRCLAAVACLTRSKKVRTKARADGSLVERAWPLSDVVPEVGVFMQALRILDDATIVVLAPSRGAGWRVAVDSMPSNLELHVLLADALVGDGKKTGRFAGKRIDPKAVAVVRDGMPAKRAPNLTLPFRLLPWNMLDEGDAASAGPLDVAAHAIPFEGLPADLPMFGEDRVVLLRDDPDAEPTAVEPTFLAVRPELRIVDDLAPGLVVRMMVSLAQATASLASNDDEEAAPKRKKKSKASAKKKTTTKKATKAKKN